mgnify:CR=1 FL=1
MYSGSLSGLGRSRNENEKRNIKKGLDGFLCFLGHFGILLTV